MKLSLLALSALIISAGVLYASPGLAQRLDNTRLKVSFRNEPLTSCLQRVSALSSIQFAFNPAELESLKSSQLQFNRTTVRRILETLLSETDLVFEENKGLVVIYKPVPDTSASTAPTPVREEITGQVRNKEGEPLPGVTVKVKGGSSGAVTDANGQFRVLADPGAVLQFSALGYEMQDVTVPAGKEGLRIMLVEKINNLDQLVVVGYGTQRKSDLTGAISSVRAAEIKDLPVRSMNEALQGRAAGVYVTKGSGAAGAGSDIIIRGAASINGIGPLYIVDGVRMGTGNNFNIQDVASVEVLKDAASASIYGAQAAGGVILITTKKGRNQQKMQVNFSANYGWRNAVSLPVLLGTPDYIAARKNIGQDYTQGKPVNELPDTDWMEALFRSGVEQTYNLSVSGGSNKSVYFLSANYQKEEGIKTGNWFERYGLRINSEHQLSKRLKFGENLYAWKTRNRPVDGGIPYRSIPTMLVYDPNNPTDKTWGVVPDGFGGDNPVGQALVRDINNNYFALEGNAYADWQIIEGLNLRTTFGAAIGGKDETTFEPIYFWGKVNNGISKLNKAQDHWENLSANLVLTYARSFGAHDLKAMAGYEVLKNDGSFTSVGAQDFKLSPSYNTALSIQNTRTGDGGITLSRTLSQFGRINYGYGGRYLLAASIRRDGSDKFSPANKWGVFPSVSGGWRISEESFVKGKFAWLDNLKLRAGWGKLGNDGIGQFLYDRSYRYISRHNYGNGVVTGWGISKFPNEDIKWEEVAQTDLGIDLSVLRERLSITADWYNRITSNMLYDLPMPATGGLGFSTTKVNLGKIQNKGFEIAATWQETHGAFNYSVSGNASFNSNKVLKLGLPNAVLQNGWPGDYWNGNTSRTEDGYPMGQFYGFITDGLFTTNDEVQQLNSKAPGGLYWKAETGAGDLRYRDLNGDGKIDDRDKTYIGNPWPAMIYGLNLQAQYKGISLTVLFQGVNGMDIYYGNRRLNQTFSADYNTTADIFGLSYFGNNGLTEKPRMGYFDAGNNYKQDPSGNYKEISSYFVENGAYVKLKTLQVAYDLPKRILEKAKLSQLRISLNAQNLLTFTKYSGLDPELGGGVRERGIENQGLYPQTRYIGFGLELSF